MPSSKIHQSNLTPILKEVVVEAQESTQLIESTIHPHVVDKNNPHAVTAAQVGADPAGSAEAVRGELTSHVNNKSNPHGVTAAQVGADPVGSANTALEEAKGYTDEQVGSLGEGFSSVIYQMYGTDLTEEGAPTIREIAVDEAGKVQSNLTSHINNKSNPHSVTKAQVGLGNVDNTSDINKPVSTEQGVAIADAKKAGTDAQANLTTHINNKSNPHSVTKAQVGLGNVDNTADSAKPVSTAQATAIADAKKAGTDAQSQIAAHKEDSTVHFTAAERTKLAGITTGANKYEHPTSGVTAGTYKSVTVNAQGHVTAGTNPTTLAGYGITDAEAKGTTSTHNTASNAHNDIRLLISDLSNKLNAFLDVDDETLDQVSEIIKLVNDNVTTLEGILATKVNINDIVNNLTTNVSNKPLSAAQGVAIKSTTDGIQAALTTHTTSKNNPHEVTAAQVGLGKVNNTADSEKTVKHAATATNLTNLTATVAELNVLDGITASTAELNYVDGVTSNIQTQLNAKASLNTATDAANGLMSAADKAKLDKIEAEANKYTLPTASSSTLGGVKIGSNLSISSGTLSVPAASGTSAGVTIVYPAASCTTFSSDSGTVTPLAVQKGAKMFAITRPTSSTNKAITRYSNTTGDVQDSKILIEDVTNSKDSSKKAQVLSIPAEGGKKMVYGYCTDQVDGTSFIGGVFDANATSFPYAEGLAIGGTSGNLLWKGKRVTTVDDIPAVPVQSVNGKTGAVSLTASDVSAYTKTEVDTKLSNVKVDVTSSIPMHFSINANGGLTITYDDGK